MALSIFQFPNSKITGQDFDLKLAPKKCEIIDLDCERQSDLNFLPSPFK